MGIPTALNLRDNIRFAMSTGEIRFELTPPIKKNFWRQNAHVYRIQGILILIGPPRSPSPLCSVGWRRSAHKTVRIDSGPRLLQFTTTTTIDRSTNLGIHTMMSFPRRSALLLLCTAVLYISGNGLSTALAEKTAPLLYPRVEYATCDDIPFGVSIIKTDVYISGDIICNRVKASAEYMHATAVYSIAYHTPAQLYVV